MAKATWPTRWLMTDERMGDELVDAIQRLPLGGGIVFRHHSLPPEERARLGLAIMSLARERGLVLAVSRDHELALRLGAALVHNPVGPTSIPFSRSVHSMEEAQRARGCALAFVSPVRPTRSHAHAQPLDERLCRGILGVLDAPAIALGGMDEEQFSRLHGLGFHGWAGIDAWLRT